MSIQTNLPFVIYDNIIKFLPHKKIIFINKYYFNYVNNLLIAKNKILTFWRLFKKDNIILSFVVYTNNIRYTNSNSLNNDSLNINSNLDLIRNRNNNILNNDNLNENYIITSLLEQIVLLRLLGLDINSILENIIQQYITLIENNPEEE